MKSLGFYVLAPESQITRGIFDRHLTHSSIQETVARRVSEYMGAKDGWYQTWFLPTLEKIDICAVSWEQLVQYIMKKDSLFGIEVQEFYQECVKFNRPAQLHK